MCCQQQETLDSLAREVLSGQHAGLGVTSWSRVHEISSQSGLPHSHWQCWTRAGEALSAQFSGLVTGDPTSLSREDLNSLLEVGQAAITVSTTVPTLLQQFPLLTEHQAEEVVRLARKYQKHNCTPHCNSTFPPGQNCNQYFPKLPTLLPVIANLKSKDKCVSELHENVQALLRQHQSGDQVDENPMVALLELLAQAAAPPVLQPSRSYLWAGMTIERTLEFEQLLAEVAGLPGIATDEQHTLLALWQYTLRFRRHPKFLPVRRVEEAWIVNFNPVLLLHLKTNIELDLVTHTLHKLHAYHGKGATSQAIGVAAEQLEGRGGARNAALAEYSRMASEGHFKEMSLTESFFRLDPRLKLSVSSNQVLWVRLQPPSPMVLLYSLR